MATVKTFKIVLPEEFGGGEYEILEKRPKREWFDLIAEAKETGIPELDDIYKFLEEWVIAPKMTTEDFNEDPTLMVFLMMAISQQVMITSPERMQEILKKVERR